MREFPKYATCSRTDGGGLFWPSVQPGQLGRVGLKSSLVNYWWRIVKKHRAFVEAWGICTWKRMLLATLLQCQLRTLQPATDACCAPPHTLYLLLLSLLHHTLICLSPLTHLTNRGHTVSSTTDCRSHSTSPCRCVHSEESCSVVSRWLERWSSSLMQAPQAKDRLSNGICHRTCTHAEPHLYRSIHRQDTQLCACKGEFSARHEHGS